MLAPPLLFPDPQGERNTNGSSSGKGEDGNDPNENTSGQGPVKKYLMLVVSSLVQLPGIVDVNIWNN